MCPMQDEYVEAINRLHSTIQFALAVNKSVRFEIFIHKVDGLSDELKLEVQREIHMRVMEEIQENAQIRCAHRSPPTTATRHATPRTDTSYIYYRLLAACLLPAN